MFKYPLLTLFHTLLLSLCLICLVISCGRRVPLGLFEKESDIGQVKFRGFVQFDGGKNEYRITGSGENMWSSKDAFHFVWKEVQGDLEMVTDIRWIGPGSHEHRKAGWVVRQGLEPDAPYADAIVHGDGLISLQYRATKGGETMQIQSPVKAPARIKLVRDGDLFTMYVAKDYRTFQPVGSILLSLQNPLQAGLAVCSHDSTVQETAVFTNASVIEKGIFSDENRAVESTLELYSLDSGERRIVHRAADHFEAPNWSQDGTYLLFNSKGKLYTIPVNGGQPQALDTGFATNCNNDHGFSPEGTRLAISHSIEHKSFIYTLPASGGEPKRVTSEGPSYWHGWSPDGKTLAYCAQRDGEYDVYTIPANGGREKRLTTAAGLDDGPDYSPDGKYIYFNSVRSGRMKIWRMEANGSSQKQMTFDDLNDWFPHPSPDGQWIVFMSYEKDVEGHPPNKPVILRIMPAAGGEPKAIAKLFGGQGTINVPSWSPDSKEFAFVSYRLIGASMQ